MNHKNQLNKYRKRCGLTMMDITRKTDGKFSQSRLSAYETGQRQLTVNAALELSSILGATPAELLGISDKNTNSEQFGELQQELIDLIAAISLRGDSEVSRISAMLRAYLGAARN